MKIEEDKTPNSGYQPRPVAPPSAGRALGVLVAVCVVLGVWWLLPQWYAAGIGDREGMRTIRNVLGSAVLTVPVWSNCAVFWWATRPMWRAEGAYARLMLVICLFFHLAWLLLGLLALLYSVADAPHFG